MKTWRNEDMILYEIFFYNNSYLMIVGEVISFTILSFVWKDWSDLSHEIGLQKTDGEQKFKSS